MKNETFRMLHQMRLSAMADAYEHQLEHPETYASMDFGDRFSLLVQREYDVRCSNHLKRLLKNANFLYPDASMDNIEYLPDRHLNKELLHFLRTNSYIEKHQNVILIGATGSGKTYIANALGVNACHDDFKVLYIRLPDLFYAYQEAVFKNKRDEFMRKCQKTTMLIIDEFLLYKATEEQQQTLLEIMERRVGQTTTVVCSQYDTAGWIEQLGGSVIADAILDRLTSSSYTIKIDGEASMRKRHATC